MMNEKIIPYQSCSKWIFIFLGIVLILWSIVFSLILILYGAWPITIFLGIEYLLLMYLVIYYFKEKNISENIVINSREIKIEKMKNNEILQTISFNTYWSKVNFYRFKNTSILTIKQSAKEQEVVSFLHSDLKEKLYSRIKKYL